MKYCRRVFVDELFKKTQSCGFDLPSGQTMGLMQTGSRVTDPGSKVICSCFLWQPAARDRGQRYLITSNEKEACCEHAGLSRKHLTGVRWGNAPVKPPPPSALSRGRNSD